MTGLGAATELAKAIEDRWPDAAASLREGLDEMFTVRRIGLSDALARTLTNTNAIESMISICRDAAGNVKRWRVKGRKDMPVLVDALVRHAGAATDARSA